MRAMGLLTMPDVLFIKTSSLGDVIHHMPALMEARRQRPAARFCWVVEEAFAPLVQIHPAISDVIPVAWRRSPVAAGMATTRTVSVSERRRGCTTYGIASHATSMPSRAIAC